MRALKTSLWVVILSGCRGFFPDDPKLGLPTPTTPTKDSPFPSVFGLSYMSFAVDSQNTLQALPEGLSGEPSPITLVITLADGSFAGGLSAENSCEVVLALQTFIEPDSVSPSGVWRSFTLPPNSTFDDSDCSEFPLPEDWLRMGFTSFGEIVSSRTWSIGIGPLSPETASSLAQQWEDYDLIEPFLIGGRYRFADTLPSPFTDGWIDTPAGFGYQIDGSGSILFADGAPLLLDAATIPVAGEISAGWYEIEGATLLSPADLLLP